MVASWSPSPMGPEDPNADGYLGDPRLGASSTSQSRHDKRPRQAAKDMGAELFRLLPF